MLNLYKEKKYKEACDIGLKNLYKFPYDEQYLSLYGFSCLKAD
jgi:hypothetical protein